jgi:agmatine deiminase
MPAEWAPHRATWLAWPHNLDTWPGKFEPVPAIWQRFVEVLAGHEAVEILAARGSVMDDAHRLVGAIPNVRLHDIPTNDCWIRDFGPTFLVGPERQRAMVDWRYNAWGGKYPPFDDDDRATAIINEKLRLPRFEPGIILEGGSIEVNGEGAVLTTESCLLNPNRNPGMTRERIEQYLADYHGAPHVIWLEGHMAGDDTDGHIDQLARFVGPRTVVAVVEEDPAEENYEPLADNIHRLQTAVDQDGRPLELVTLPMPRPRYLNHQRLPASYANFYIANGAVIVPTFGDPADQIACDTLSRLFPDRQIVPIGAIDLVCGLGAFHCMTQQEPAATEIALDAAKWQDVT